MGYGSFCTRTLTNSLMHRHTDACTCDCRGVPPSLSACSFSRLRSPKQRHEHQTQPLHTARAHKSTPEDEVKVKERRSLEKKRSRGNKSDSSDTTGKAVSGSVPA